MSKEQENIEHLLLEYVLGYYYSRHIWSIYNSLLFVRAIGQVVDIPDSLIFVVNGKKFDFMKFDVLISAVRQ